MTYTDRELFTAIVNAERDCLEMVFGDATDNAIAKAAKKLANIENNSAKRKAEGSAKKAENVETFNEKVSGYLAANGFATVASIRNACFGDDIAPSKIVAVLKAAIADGLCESKATAKATYYGLPGFELPENIA